MRALLYHDSARVRANRLPLRGVLSRRFYFSRSGARRALYEVRRSVGVLRSHATLRIAVFIRVVCRAFVPVLSQKQYHYADLFDRVRGVAYNNRIFQNGRARRGHFGTLPVAMAVDNLYRGRRGYAVNLYI